jgi:hypothetical protein
MKKVDYSHDGVHWYVTASPDWKLRREREDAPTKDREEIIAWLSTNDKAGVRIEYSTDGGYSFVPFRRKYIDEDSGRIFSMMKMGYQVRSVEISDMNINSVLQTGGQPQTAGNFKTMDITNYIYHDTEYKWTSNPRSNYISKITMHIPLTMHVINTNECEPHHSMIGRIYDPIMRGHIYAVTLINAKGMIDKVESDIIEEKTGKDITDFAYVIAPRVWDDETDALGFYGCNVISHKYFVDSKKQGSKIGSRFFIYKSTVTQFVNTVNSNGGAAYVGYSEAQVIATEQSLTEVIMQQEQKLKEALQSGDLAAISQAIFEAMEFRNEAVDALSAFNATLKEAREQARAMVAAERQTNS